MLHEEHGIWSELWKIGGIEIAERRAIIWGKSESVSHSVMSDSLQPCGLYVARQAPLSIGFSRQEYWSGLPFPSPGDLPNPGIKPRSPSLQADTLTSEPPGKPAEVHKEGRIHIWKEINLIFFHLVLRWLLGISFLLMNWRRKCNPLQYSCLENPMDGGAWQATYSPWGRKDSDTTERLRFFTQSRDNLRGWD